MNYRLSYDSAESGFLYIRTAGKAGSYASIAYDSAVGFAAPCFLEYNMIDERGIIIMIDGTPMIGMPSTLLQRPYPD